MNSRHLLTLGAVGVISAAAFLLGRATAPLERGAGTAASGPAARSSYSRAHDTSGTGARSESRRSAGQAVAGNGGVTPEATVAILKTPDLLERSQAWLKFVNSLRAEQFVGALDQLRGSELGGGDAASAAQLFAAWAKLDPENASKYAGRHDGELDAVFATWLQQDASAAMAWAEKKGAEGDAMWLPTLMNHMAEVDPARATHLLETFPFKEARGAGLDVMVSQMVEQGEDASKAWLATITDADLRTEATNCLTEKLAHQNPAIARTYLESLPAGDERANALNGIIRDFTRKDPQEASDLINSFTGEVSQGLRQHFILESLSTAPELSMRQIENFPDQAERDAAYKKSLCMWMLLNRPAASAWMQNNALPSGVREEVDRRYRSVLPLLGRNQ